MNKFINTNYTFANLKQRKEGVCYVKKTNRWLVRILNKRNTVSTLAKFKKQQQAIEFYKSICLNKIQITQ